MSPEDRFLISINEIYPALAERLAEEREFFHTQLSMIENRVAESIRRREYGKAKKAFLLALRLYHDGDDELRSLVDTGFVEGVLSLLEPEDRDAGYSIMPKAFQELYSKFWDNL